MTLREAHSGRHGVCVIGAAHMHAHACPPPPEPIVVEVAAEPRTVTVVASPEGLTTALVLAALSESLTAHSAIVRHKGTTTSVSAWQLAESLAVRLRKSLALAVLVR